MAENSLDSLIKARKVIKSTFTRFITYFNSIKDTECTSDILIQLNLRLERSEPLLTEFMNVQDSIDNILIKEMPQNVSSTDRATIEAAERANLEKSEQERSSFEDIYYNHIAQVKSYIVRANQSTTTSISTSNIPQNNSVGLTSGVKLPNLNLPTFTGSYSEWMQFNDIFKSLIDSDTSLSNTQKFYYLKSCLEGEAATILDSLKVTDLNYTIAWQLLQDRYQNKKIIVNNHLKHIFDLDPINKESHQALRHMFDTVTKHVRCLTSIGQPTDQWDTILVYLVSNKFDNNTKRAWEQFDCAGDLPTFAELSAFLKKRCEILETLSSNFRKQEPNISTKKPNIHSYHSNTVQSCVYCAKSHNVYNCSDFLKLPITERIKQANLKKFCTNCLRKNHSTKDCKASNCRVCNKKHHTLLHIVSNTNQTQNGQNSNVANPLNGNADNNTPAETFAASSVINMASSNFNNILLATAVVKVLDSNGMLHPCRILLDSASQSNFITENLCKKLNLKMHPTNSCVIGINQNQSNIKFKTEIKIVSNHNAFTVDLSCLVLNQITGHLPSVSFDGSAIQIPPNLRLADPDFNISTKIDVLLGASVFWRILCAGQIDLGFNKPILQKTQFGWILSGNCETKLSSKESSNYAFLCTEDHFLERQVSTFWELDSVQTKPNLSQQDLIVEKHFLETTQRDNNGRYIVSIPFKEAVSKLGESRHFLACAVGPTSAQSYKLLLTLSGIV